MFVIECKPRIVQLEKSDEKSISNVTKVIKNKIPDAEISVFELLSDSIEIPSKKALIIANTVNIAFGGDKAIVTEKKESGFNEIGIKSLYGSAIDTYIVNFIGEKDTAHLVISDNFSYFTYG